MCGYTWEGIVEGNRLTTEEDIRKRDEWIQKKGGTMEFCRPITQNEQGKEQTSAQESTGTSNEEAQGTEEAEQGTTQDGTQTSMDSVIVSDIAQQQTQHDPPNQSEVGQQEERSTDTQTRQVEPETAEQQSTQNASKSARDKAAEAAEIAAQEFREDVEELANWEFYDPGETWSTPETIMHGVDLFDEGDDLFDANTEYEL